jgi:hypothetical protein
MRRTLCAVSVAVLMAVLAPSATANSVSKPDVTGDSTGADITRIKLDNRRNVVVGRVKYVDVAQVRKQIYHFDWGDGDNYAVIARDFRASSAGFEFRLYRWQDAGYESDYYRHKCSGVIGSRDFGDDLMNIRVPRKCIADASDSLRSYASAHRRESRGDWTVTTPFVDRG